ncbi:hypothetical protein INT45_008873 [Circinella minor]|uniref:Uncharacterized protein n=1 Tax=Circinella minor TaxID=1195481 RepID=A0A8H7RYT0_9FUNG|nr:hypothetical protein INT45_008873 [Circinella minor]
MQLKQFIGVTALFASIATAVPINKEFCGTEDSVQYGDYNVYNNLVGRSKSGTQCTRLIKTGQTDNVGWSTTWSWSGEEKKIKSFANAAYHFEPKVISDIKSILINWNWSTGGVVKKSNVALELYTYASPEDSEKDYDYKISIWLGKTGSTKPLGNRLDSPIFSTGDGNEYQIYIGYNGVQNVVTFVATKQVKEFDGDAFSFIRHLIDTDHFPDSQVLGAIRGGITAYVGDKATFTTKSFQVSVN